MLSCFSDAQHSTAPGLSGVLSLLQVWRLVGIVGIARIVYMAGIAKVPCAPAGTLESLDVTESAHARSYCSGREVQKTC